MSMPPKHVAFIMDGNSTWAAKNNVTAMNGYLKGMRTMAQIILDSIDLGINYATFYAFSMENWERPKNWVSDFMALALRFFKNDEYIKKILDANAKLKVIGDTSRLPQDLRNILTEYEQKTEHNNAIIVQMAISYSSRDEIVRAAKKISESGGEFSVENLSNNLDTAGIPDPDLIVRTSSKQRLSNFLLWQAAYSEFFFSDLLWPDFSKQELQKALDEFSTRIRTYGK